MGELAVVAVVVGRGKSMIVVVVVVVAAAEMNFEEGARECESVSACEEQTELMRMRLPSYCYCCSC